MVKLALVGCGRWGSNYLKTLTSIRGCELNWVCDLDLEKLKEAVSAYPHLKYTKNVADLLNDSTVQGVIIATTPESHYTLAKEFIKKGKSVLVEKPVTIQREESFDLINLAAAQNTILMAGFTLIYHPAVSIIKRILEENSATDQVCYLNMSRTNYSSRVAGVGVLHDLAIHDLYLARHLIGEDPSWVMAQGGSYPTLPSASTAESSLHNVIFILLGFPHGQIASILASFIHTKKTRNITLVTPNIKLVFDDVLPADRKIQLFSDGECYQVSIPGENPEPLKHECLHFIECISKNKQPQSGQEDISFIAKITDYIADSLAQGGEKVIVR